MYNNIAVTVKFHQSYNRVHEAFRLGAIVKSAALIGWGDNGARPLQCPIVNRYRPLNSKFTKKLILVLVFYKY